MASATVSTGGATTGNRNKGNMRRGRDLSNYGYCWSHGFMKNTSHTSLTCENKKYGHKDDAAATNKMGGKEHVW